MAWAQDREWKTSFIQNSELETDKIANAANLKWIVMKLTEKKHIFSVNCYVICFIVIINVCYKLYNKIDIVYIVPWI